MRNPTEVLKNLMEKSKNETYRFQRLYRNLYNPEFYWLAYKNIYANDGSMTAGADGTTIDGMGNERIERIILSLKDRSYQPKPARREYMIICINQPYAGVKQTGWWVSMRQGFLRYFTGTV